MLICVSGNLPQFIVFTFCFNYIFVLLPAMAAVAFSWNVKQTAKERTQEEVKQLCRTGTGKLSVKERARKHEEERKKLSLAEKARRAAKQLSASNAEPINTSGALINNENNHNQANLLTHIPKPATLKRKPKSKKTFVKQRPATLPSAAIQVIIPEDWTEYKSEQVIHVFQFLVILSIEFSAFRALHIGTTQSRMSLCGSNRTVGSGPAPQLL